ncbi:MAG: radical SAM protein [Alphaproteobacteria bacterium]|nr:radical SAM protein [Alphaproteobacteria bacterium]MCB9796598.1 radical SAM protein [Alphaproteobacteria bacterium]
MSPLSQVERDARMYLSRALNRSLAPPDWVSVNLTLQCNLKCTMCTTCYDVPQELTTAEVKDIIDQTALWGVKVFNPLGGEPFMRGDLEELLDYACRKDFYITLTTNGTLINQRRARMIAGIPPDRLHFNISLDGPEAAHDRIRGEGMYRRTMAGYQRLREADAAAGNSRRKVLANTLIHRLNLETLPALLDELAERGFEGVQLLNLFRHGEGDPEDPGNLWIRERDLPALQALIDALIARVQAQGRAGFRILNSVEDLALVPSYYRDELQPLEAPCWSGWKELYINAEGTAIMCDGSLDFLAGTLGSVRKQTLRQIWDSPELKARREVVKACRTPCIQNCYLRRDSDSAQAIGREAVDLVVRRLKRRAARWRERAAGERVEGGVLTLELADAAPWAAPWDPSTLRRFQDFAARSPRDVAACWQDPALWLEYRDRGYLDFGRGFMGFEVVQSVVEDLAAARLVFPTLSLSWRGEPLMHPEADRVLRYLLTAIRERGVFERLELRTDARLLHPRLLDVVAEFSEIPMDWVLHGNGFAPVEAEVQRNVQALLAVRGGAHRVIASWVVDEAIDPFAFVEDWQRLLRDPWVAVGRPRAQGDGIWFRRSDHDHFQATAEARERLAELAEILGVEADTGEEQGPRRCRSAERTPVVSWDGKLTLCQWDTGLENRVGEVTSDALSRIWREEPALVAARREARGKGVPGLGRCRDCHDHWSPNHRG